MPRFIGAITKQNVSISCVTSEGTVQWYKLKKYDDDRNKAVEVKKVGKTIIQHTHLVILDVRVEHKGVYFCKLNDTWGPGTELHVASKGTAERPSSLMSGNVSTNTLSSSPRASEPSQRSVQDTDEGRFHHPPGSAADCVYSCSNAAQASAGEQSAVKVVLGLYHSHV